MPGRYPYCGFHPGDTDGQEGGEGGGMEGRPQGLSLSGHKKSCSGTTGWRRLLSG